MKALIALALLFSLNSEAACATIRLILVGDTLDISIGEGVKSNVNEMLSLFHDISEQTGYTLIANQLTDKNFTCDAISHMIEQLPSQNNDVIVFYYSGHGYRGARTASVFPNFYCGEIDFSAGAPSLANITNKLKGKNPRLLLSIADTCNVVISPITIQQFPATAARGNRADAYRQLLQSYKGVGIASSSKPGQYSWYYPSGGLFTKQFIRSFDKYTQTGNAPAWERIFSDAAAEISISVPNGDPDGFALVKQNPQFNIDDLVKIN